MQLDLTQKHEIFDEFNFGLLYPVMLLNGLVKLFVIEISDKYLETMNFLDLVLLEDLGQLREFGLARRRQRNWSLRE